MKPTLLICQKMPFKYFSVICITEFFRNLSLLPCTIYYLTHLVKVYLPFENIQMMQNQMRKRTIRFCTAKTSHLNHQEEYLWISCKNNTCLSKLTFLSKYLSLKKLIFLSTIAVFSTFSYQDIRIIFSFLLGLYSLTLYCPFCFPIFE